MKRRMKINLEINDMAGSGLEEIFLLGVVSKTLSLAEYEPKTDKTVSISLAIVSEEEIKKLNRTYRKIDSATDILSFPEFQSKEDLEKNSCPEMFLGELVMCYNDIKKYCKKNGLDLSGETARVVSHGVLHLLGFVHGKKMFGLQDEAAKKITG